MEKNREVFAVPTLLIKRNDYMNVVNQLTKQNYEKKQNL